LALEKGWADDSALALMVPGIAWVARQAAFAGRCGVCSWLRSACSCWRASAGEPRIVGSDIGTNAGLSIGLLLRLRRSPPPHSGWGGYLLPATAARRQRPARMIDSGALLLTVLAAFLEIRHFISGRRTSMPTRRVWPKACACRFAWGLL